MTAPDPLDAVKAKVRLNLVRAGCPIPRAARAVELAFAAADAAMIALVEAVGAAAGPLEPNEPATETLALQLAFPLVQERLFRAEAGLRAGLAAIPSPPPKLPEVLQ